MTILTLGPAGTFSHEAAQHIFPDATITFAPNFDRVFDHLQANPAAIGLVPIENSLHGSVDEILDLLRETDVRMWRTHEVRIRHACGSLDSSKVQTIASHPQALRQSRAWIKATYPEALLLPTSSTAAAVERAEEDPTIAAIASPRRIASSRLTLIKEDVEGDANTTRFAIVSRTDPFPGSTRTQMSIAIHPPREDRPGLLHLLLTPFKIYDINLSRIENRPTGKRLGDYNFFIDFSGSSSDPRTKKVLEELKKIAEIRVLGEW